MTHNPSGEIRGNEVPDVLRPGEYLLEKAIMNMRTRCGHNQSLYRKDEADKSYPVSQWLRAPGNTFRKRLILFSLLNTGCLIWAGYGLNMNDKIESRPHENGLLVPLIVTQ